jgi:ABC-type antimicrobial peptide transport system permease subunit
MNKTDIMRLALKNFLRRKTRSILTILGVIIGTASIVVMLSLGIGMNESYRKQLESMGSLNVINVNTFYVPENATGMVKVTESVLNDEAIEKIAQIDGVEAVTPILQTSLKIADGKFVTYGNVMGIDPSVLKAFDYKVASGRLLNSDDTDAILFGSQAPYNFQNPRLSAGGGMVFIGGMGGEGEKQKPPVDVLNDKLLMTFDMNYGERKSVGDMQTQIGAPTMKPYKIYKTRGVGLLEDSQDEKAYSIIMNITYLRKLIKEEEKRQASSGGRIGRSQADNYQEAMVKVKDINNVSAIQKKINEMGYGANSLGDILKSMQKTSATMQAVLGGIGAISLFVAALGITNTMIMSIYERTREIGVMKVLGCLLGDIRAMFLMEAGLIGFIGGVVGLLFSYGASYILNKFAGGFLGGGGAPGENTISVIPVWLGLASLGFATLVGLISGFMPARRAMKLSALEAIKTE